MPPIGSSTWALRRASVAIASDRGADLVPGLRHGRGDGVLGDVAGHRQAAGAEVHVDRGHAVELGDLLPNRPDAVLTGHALDEEGARRGAAHEPILPDTPRG